MGPRVGESSRSGNRASIIVATIMTGALTIGACTPSQEGDVSADGSVIRRVITQAEREISDTDELWAYRVLCGLAGSAWPDRAAGCARDGDLALLLVVSADAHDREWFAEEVSRSDRAGLDKYRIVSADESLAELQELKAAVFDRLGMALRIEVSVSVRVSENTVVVSVPDERLMPHVRRRLADDFPSVKVLFDPESVATDT